MKNLSFLLIRRACLPLFSVLLLFSQSAYAQKQPYTMMVFYPDGAGIDAMLKETVESVLAPDFNSTVYRPLKADVWNDRDALSQYIIGANTSTPVSGFVLACKNNDLNYISGKVRKKFPKVPFVDTIAPSLLAANVISYRYMAVSGSPQKDPDDILGVIEDLSIQGHLKIGGYKEGYLIRYNNFTLSYVPTDLELAEMLVEPYLYLFKSDSLDSPVINAEAIALVGCEGFISEKIAGRIQYSFAYRGNVPIQVVHPIKAAVTQLDVLIRNKTWISSPY